MSERLSYNVEVMSKLLVLTPRRVQQLANEGVIIKTGRGRYDLIQSVQGYIGYLNELIPNKQSNDEGVQVAKVDIEVEKAKLFKHKAELARLEEEERKGILVNKEDERTEMFRLGRIVRNGVLAVPARLAQGLAAETDAMKVHRMLEHELIDTLTELSHLAKSDDPLPDRDNNPRLDPDADCGHWLWCGYG